jgi:hypothetical protein
MSTGEPLSFDTRWNYAEMEEDAREEAESKAEMAGHETVMVMVCGDKMVMANEHRYPVQHP